MAFIALKQIKTIYGLTLDQHQLCSHVRIVSKVRHNLKVIYYCSH